MVHGGSGGHGAGVKGLYLVGAKTVALEPKRQVHHVCIAGARVGRDKVGDKKLLLARFSAVLVKQLPEGVLIALCNLEQQQFILVLGIQSSIPRVRRSNKNREKNVDALIPPTQ